MEITCSVFHRDRFQVLGKMQEALVICLKSPDWIIPFLHPQEDKLEPCKKPQAYLFYLFKTFIYCLIIHISKQFA